MWLKNRRNTITQFTSNIKTPEPSPILAKYDKLGSSINKIIASNELDTINQSKFTHTNPSRPQSKGREASEGEELYLVVKALALESKRKMLSAKYNMEGVKQSNRAFKRIGGGGGLSYQHNELTTLIFYFMVCLKERKLKRVKH